jgi:hypothetical protein
MTTEWIPWPAAAARTALRTRRPISTVISPGIVTIIRSPSRRATSGTALGTSSGMLALILSPWGPIDTGEVRPSNGTCVSSYSGPRPSSEPVSSGRPIWALVSTGPTSVFWPQKQTLVQRMSMLGVRDMRRPAERHADIIERASTRPT